MRRKHSIKEKDINVVKTNELSEAQRVQIERLQREVFVEEELQNFAYLSNDINARQEVPCFYLAYEKEDLVAFLTTFMPSSIEAEVMAVTKPSYQRKGYFTMLWKEAREVLLELGMRQVLFVIEAKSRSGRKVLSKYPSAFLERSEYHMVCKRKPKAGMGKAELNFLQVTKENIEEFTMLTKKIFHEIEDDTNFYDALLFCREREGVLGIAGSDPVGVLNLCYEEGQTYLYGVGVSEEARGNGYGKEVVAYGIRKGLSRRERVVLDVDSHNAVAFNLYQKMGFTVESQVDYYSIELE